MHAKNAIPLVGPEAAGRPLQLCTTVPALDPAVLAAETEASVRSFLIEGESANTRRSYASAMRYWAAWSRLRYGGALEIPVHPQTVMQFVVDHLEHQVEGNADDKGAGLAEVSAVNRPRLGHDLPRPIDAALVKAGYKGALGPLALGTVAQRLAVLSKVHTLQGQANPTRDPAVQELMKRVRRAYARREVSPVRKTALPREPLEKMLATCTDGLVGVRDRALLLFAWASGGRRRSEVTGAVMERLTRVEGGHFLYELTHSKTDQAGAAGKPEAYKPVTGAAAAALAAWLAASRLESGPIFRRVLRGAIIGGALRPQAVARIVQRRAQLAGLTGDFGAHSLRSGFVTEAAAQGVSLLEAMALTGHKSVQTAMRYFQPGAVRLSKAANLLDNKVNARQSSPK